MSLFFQAASFVGGILVIYILLTYRFRNTALPPGPKGWPVVGNLFDIPRHETYRGFAEWKKVYGDVVFIRMFGTPMLILNSSAAAIDLLTKRSNIYSDRPPFTMPTLAGWDHSMVLLPYGERLREQRRMMAALMGTRSRVEAYGDTLEHEAQKYAKRLQEIPHEFQKPLRRAIFAMLLIVTHGYKVDSEDDPFAKRIDEITEQLEYLTPPGKWLANVIPSLKYIPNWLPGATFKRVAAACRAELFSLVEDTYNFAKNQAASGISVPSFVARMIDAGEDVFNTKWVGFNVYAGGSDSPIQAMNSFFLAMLLYPDVMRKAQAEIDAVVGGERWPCLSDRDRMPYVLAIIKELLRWAPGTPLGAPHLLTTDDEYRGFFIPKGTTVVANLWAFTHDENIYPDPMKFDPHRFMEDSGNVVQTDPHDLAFGYGRRICPGTHLADAVLFVFITTTLAVYDIQPFVKDGVEQIPEAKWHGEILTGPKPFKATVSVRSAGAQALLSTPNE